MSRQSGTVGSRALLLALAALVVMLAGWWLLRGDAPARKDVAVLGRPAAAPPMDAVRPGFEAPAADATPVAFGRAAERLDAEITPDAAVDAAPLELTLLHHDGAPATGVTALLCVGQTIVESRVTDSAGSARFAPLDGAATLIVGGASDVPLLLPLATASGRQQLTLPEGLIVAGHVLVDGARPVRPFLLALKALPVERQVTLPVDGWALSAVVPGFAQDPMQNAQLVGLDGRFRFSALPAPWRGRFEIEWQAVPAGNKAGSLEVQAPAPDVLLDLTSTLTVHGRVVDVGGGAPVPGARIAYELAEDDGGSHSSVFSAGPDGRFSIPAAWHAKALRGLQLAIRHPQGRGFRDVRFTAEDLARSLDLGDIELQPTRVVTFVVLDEDGATVPGAIAVADDISATRSRPTDAQGRGELIDVLLETVSMTVWAHRHFEQSVPLPPAHVTLDADHPVTVVLARCPTLDVVVSGPEGVRLSDLEVQLVGAQKLFSSSSDAHGGAFTPSSLVHELGTSLSRFSSSQSKQGADGRRELSGSMAFEVSSGGRVTVSNLLPGVPFELSVQGQEAGSAWGPQTLSLQPGEAREVHVVLERGPVALAVRAVDPQGVPLPGTSVIASWPGKAPGGSVPRTDDAGVLEFQAVFGDTLTLRLSKSGYASRTVDVPIVDRGGVPLDVVLIAGLQVDVRVRDASGRDVAADSVSAALDDKAVGHAARQEGVTLSGTITSGARSAAATVRGSRWRISDLPDATVTLTARVGGSSFTQQHDTRVPQAEIVVPAVGALHVRLNLPLDATLQHKLELQAVASGADGDPPVRWLDDDELAAGELLLPALLPGDYEVVLSRMVDGTFAPCSRPATARVVEGETAELVLAPP